MPLITSDSKPGATRDTFIHQQQRHRDQHDSSSRSQTLLNKVDRLRKRRDSSASSDSQASNPLGATDMVLSKEDMKRRAAEMKLPTPNTIGLSANTPSKTISDLVHERDNGAASANNYSVQESNMNGRQTNFDDTTSLPFDDETSLQDDENHTMVHVGHDLQTSHKPPTRGQARRQHNTAFDDTIDLQSLDGSLRNWPEIVQKERMLQRQEGLHPAEDSRFTREAERVERQITGHGRTVTEMSLRSQMPLPHHFSRSAQPPKAVSFKSSENRVGHKAKADSPELQIPPGKTNISPAKSSSGVEPAANKGRSSAPPQYTGTEHVTHLNPFAMTFSEAHAKDNSNGKNSHLDDIRSSRASDYPTSSDDELPPTQPERSIQPTRGLEVKLRKRQREEEMDYDIATLKNMKYDELRNETFGRDPKDPVRGAPFQSHGSATSSSQNSNGLDKLTEEEQKHAFRNQNDEQWTEMGSWFIDRFQEGLKQLIEIKVERRKISLRFEDEIRRRQKKIELCSAGVEEELKDLKRGGGELIRGRDASSRRTTPQKR